MLLTKTNDKKIKEKNMFNDVLLVASAVGVFSGMLLIKKFLGKEGLIGWIGIASILANIMIVKSVRLLGMDATLGNVLFASNFLATDMLTENYSYKDAKKGVMFGAVSVIAFLIITQVALIYIPCAGDVAQESFNTIFSFTPRITLASVTLFILSNYVDIKLYEWLRKKHNGKKMWLRNNLCTIISNGSENFIFYFVAFGGLFATKDLISFAVSATIIEVIIAILDTPFLYLSKKQRVKKGVTWQEDQEKE